MFHKNSLMILGGAVAVVLVVSAALLKNKKPEYVLDEENKEVSNTKVAMYSLLFALIFGLLGAGIMFGVSKPESNSKPQFGMGKSCSSCVDMNMKKYVF